jgi:hypothetical protein
MGKENERNGINDGYADRMKGKEAFHLPTQ